MIDDPQLEPSVPVEPSEEAIRLRSQLIWEREGCPEGVAQDHWLRAKAELEAEQEHWMRAEAELAAEMEKTSTAQLAAPALWKNDFLRTALIQASSLMPKLPWPAARSMDAYAHREPWCGGSEKSASGSSREAPARWRDETVPVSPHALLMAAAKRAKQTSAAPSIIAADIVLHGTLESTGDIQLDGCVDGNVRSTVLVVGDEAVIQGDVVADDVTVRGCVRGSIRARKVHLGAKSRIEGDILYGTFTAEAGAQIEGHFRYVADPLSLENAPEMGVPEEADTWAEDAPLSRSVA